MQTPKSDTRLEISPYGLAVEIAGVMIPQNFLRVNTTKWEYTTPSASGEVVATPLSFAEMVFAWEQNNNSYICLWKDVEASTDIYPDKDHDCFKQPASADFLRQFVAWCVTDNNSALPPILTYDGKRYCKKQKTATAVDIPFHCFTDYAVNCYPPVYKNEKKEDRYGGMLKQIIAQTAGGFNALMDELHAQVASCGEPSAVPMDNLFYCNCPAGVNKVTLKGRDGMPKEYECSSTRKYHFFSSFILPE